METAKREQPGRYYHPLLATLITGAARLMLALTERLAFEHGLNWAFCDTDSMAFANTCYSDRLQAVLLHSRITALSEGQGNQ